MATEWITDFDRAEAILYSKSFREVTFKGLVPLLGHVIVTLEGAQHRERRLLAGKLFRAATLRASEDETRQTIRQMLDNCTDKADLVALSYNVSARLAAKLIGLEPIERDADALELVQLLSALVSGTAADPVHNPARLNRRQARDELRRRYLDRAINKKRNLLALHQVGRLSDLDVPADLFMLLLQHSQHVQPAWDTRQIAGEAAFFAVAAIDTTANLVPHIFHELHKFLQKRPDLTPRLADLNFIRLAAAEALRLHPAIPTLFREATARVEIAGQVFEPGTVAGIYVKEANQSSNVFGRDAAEFNPLRTVRAKTRRSGLSFGGGTHLCLGRELATGTPEAQTDDDNGLYGQAALLVHALLERSAIPDPARPVNELSPYERDVYNTYPIVFEQ
jgi:cytochrome P450